MKPFTPVLAVSSLICASFIGIAPSAAQAVDVSTINCKEFFEGPQERISYVVMWLDGYYTDEDDPPVVDFDRMKKRVTALATHCAANPTHGLITAAEEVFDK
jgi:acid stress chaperone HdeB